MAVSYNSKMYIKSTPGLQIMGTDETYSDTF